MRITVAIALCLLASFTPAQAQAPTAAAATYPVKLLTPETALKAAQAALAHCRTAGHQVAVAVVDRAGVLQVLLNVSRFGMPPERAVAAPRFHHQWAPHELKVEAGIDAVTVTELEHKGHRVVRADKLAASQAAARTEQGLTGGSDPRKGGRPRGW